MVAVVVISNLEGGRFLTRGARRLMSNVKCYHSGVSGVSRVLSRVLNIVPLRGLN